MASDVISRPCPVANVLRREAFCRGFRTVRGPAANPEQAKFQPAPPKAGAFPALSETPARFGDIARSFLCFLGRGLPQYWVETTPQRARFGTSIRTVRREETRASIDSRPPPRSWHPAIPSGP